MASPMLVEPVFHQQARERLTNPPATRCSLCGEPYDWRDPERPWHELCKARADRGLAVTPLPWSVVCGCVRCGDGFEPDAYAEDLALGRAQEEERLRHAAAAERAAERARKANPVLDLPAMAALLELPAHQREHLQYLMRQLSAQAHARAEKAPMAAYWRAVGVYAGHIGRALR